MVHQLTAARRRALRARAHPLNPVVMIGAGALAPAVLKEIDRNLASHELIKIRVFSDEHAAREMLFRKICEALAAAPVQHIGKILVVYRPQSPETGAGAGKTKPRRKLPRRTKRSFQR